MLENTYMIPGPHLHYMFQEGANAADSTRRKRVYQVWKGDNKFFLGGRLVFGPDGVSIFLTMFLIVTPVVIFCVFVGRNLMKEFPHHAGLAIILVTIVHTVLLLVLLMLTSGRDPGIIPRNMRPVPKSEEDLSSSETMEQKYCETCMLYRPPRCSHCRICNNCIDRFDHHCKWLGQCIGRRNYPHFFWFILTATLLCLFIFAMCALRIKRLMDADPPRSVGRALQKAPASVVLMAYGFLATLFVGGLTALHLYFISKNRTTYEMIRYRRSSLINVYNKGVLRNFREILCSPITPSRVNFRALVPTEEVNLSAQQSQQSARVGRYMMDSKCEEPHGDIEIRLDANFAKGVEDMNKSLDYCIR